MIEVQYHSDGFRPARPAVNVKVHAAGIDFWPDLPDGVMESLAEHGPDFVEIANDQLTARFWSDAADVADNLGLGPIEQEGRSGGWLVLTDGYDPQDDTDPEADGVSGPARVREWLTAYRLLSTWCADQVRTAPARVAAMAQQLAMDEIGAEPARRMFGTWQVDPAHNPGYVMVAGADYPQKAWTA